MKKRIHRILNGLRSKVIYPFFRKLCGWDELEEHLETIDYIINHCIDITKTKQADGVLRQCQLVDAELLRIVCQTLEKHNLPYWLDYGTLLGAVRHGGFIPWDDDLDIAMTREDYYKASELLEYELKQYGIKVNVLGEKRIGITIWKAGAILDIFPMDNVAVNSVTNYQELKERIKEFRRFYNKHTDLPSEEMNRIKERIIGIPCTDEPLWYHNPEFSANGTVYDNNTIFPLQKMQFEGYEFYVPHDYDAYLKAFYGNYMCFPKDGILHHGGGNGTRIIDNPAKYGTDMDSVIDSLKKHRPFSI